MNTKNQGKGNHLTQEGKKGGDHAHPSKGKSGHNLTQNDRVKGGKNSHK